MKDMTTQQHLLVEMKIAGIIKGDEEMEWISPNKEFKFLINRYENRLWNNEQDGHYIITIDIINMIGVHIIQIKFSEIDAVRILDAINTFLYDWDGGVGESMSIYIDPSNLRLEHEIIYLERLRTNDMNDEYIETHTIRDISFQIRQYSSFHQTLITILNLTLGTEELEELAFDIFFYSLIDIDIPTQYDQQLENFVQNLYMEKLNIEHPIF